MKIEIASEVTAEISYNKIPMTKSASLMLLITPNINYIFNNIILVPINTLIILRVKTKPVIRLVDQPYHHRQQSRTKLLPAANSYVHAP